MAENMRKSNTTIETDEQFADGRKRSTFRLPAAKQLPSESEEVTAQRILGSLLKSLNDNESSKENLKNANNNIKPSSSLMPTILKFLHPKTEAQLQSNSYSPVWPAASLLVLRLSLRIEKFS